MQMKLVLLLIRQLIEEKAASYAELQSGAAQAAQRGYVDVIISPESVRKQLVYAFEMLY